MNQRQLDKIRRALMLGSDYWGWDILPRDESALRHGKKTYEDAFAALKDLQQELTQKDREEDVHE